VEKYALKRRGRTRVAGGTTQAALVAAFLLFVGVPSTRAYALTPTQAIESTVDQVVKVVTNPKLRGKQQQARKLELLKQAIFPRFDFAAMTKRSLGPYWRRLSAGQQNQLVALFTKLLVQTYAGDIESYNNDKFIYTGGTAQGTYAEVDSKVERPNGAEVTVNYLLHISHNDWKIYDLVIDDVSVVNNYRSQFEDVLNRYSYNELVNRLKDRLSRNKVVG
jgi:phospholipid transport system substrate-binding protein